MLDGKSRTKNILSHPLLNVSFSCQKRKKNLAFQVGARSKKMRDNWHGRFEICPAGLSGLVSALYDLQALSALKM